MKVYSVRDKAFFGRGIFALFSDGETAQQFLDRARGVLRQCGEVAELAVIGKGDPLSTVFAAYVYDDLHDSHIFDGLYTDAAVAKDVAGRKGHVVKFVIGLPEEP
jgi:hypothetical protein